MLAQLLSYEATGAPHQTTRYELTRDGAGALTDVHVYESHWGDLSRLGAGAARVFGAIHQLLIHLSNSPWLRYDGQSNGQRCHTPIVPPLTIVEDPRGTVGRRKEMCLGAGAHTRYWIHPDVAAELDLLIAD